MHTTITFNELRKIKDSLPDGSMHIIAEALNLSEETVRNYFGGTHYDSGESVGVHFEQGPNGGIVYLEDTAILDKALEILGKHNTHNGEGENEQ
ncbi:DNA-binding protein [Sphingobacteriales bacterium UPWRP_1]|nr:DNA-binding protein [Sphingobacteriales bacterium TSM_CSM]PSJ79078.1 DNA-binding protein [Sphingobacteriales bacterium UPWRP_1]